ncbi:MAG: HAD family hydrolase [Micromonosporaceae bacterium]
MRAVVFDFFGTLTEPSAERLRREVYATTGTRLGADSDRFWQAMSDSFTDRATGVYGDTRSTLRAMARRCGVEPDQVTLDAAVALHLDGSAKLRTPRDGAVAALGTLRSRGYRLGLISDCSSELCEAWQDTPFAELIDVAVFSWREGRRKPDLRLYATVATGLGVAPEACWYVGDGASREHFGADRAGMRPVLIDNAGAADRYDPDAFRPSHVISDLAELHPLVGDD